MTEAFMHYIWFEKRFFPYQETVEGVPVEIIDVGRPNEDAGPDVFNAKIKLGSIVWAGNVEFHLKASDWYSHHHHEDPGYNSTILHVVLQSNRLICKNERGEIVPQIILRYPKFLEERFQVMLSPSQAFIHCAPYFQEVSRDELKFFLDRLLVERFERKVNEVSARWEQQNNNWDVAFFLTLARSFGFSTNAAAFELLGQRVPWLKVFALKTSKSLRWEEKQRALEALFLGVSGLEPQGTRSAYEDQLHHWMHWWKEEMGVSLVALAPKLWKFLRLYPAGFPTVRVAQFSALVLKAPQNIGACLGLETLPSVLKWLEVGPSPFWQSHYRFESSAVLNEKRLSKASKEGLVVNTVVPFLLAYARELGDGDLGEKVLHWLEVLPPESNKLIRGFRGLGLEVHSAYDTQALTQLKTAYCNKRNCLRCVVGHQILKY